MTERVSSFKVLANKDDQIDKYKSLSYLLYVLEQRKNGYKETVLLLPFSYSMTGSLVHKYFAFEP